LVIRVAPVEIGLGIFRVEPDRLVVVGFGAAEVTLVIVGEAAAGISLSKFRIAPDRFVVFGDGAVVVALVIVGEATTAPPPVPL
jgi:hypothetical protein